MKHIQITVTGKVQGVYFRASAKAKAQELSITGFARNQPDGSVYIEAEGTEDALTLFIEWCHRGPANARVRSVEISEGTRINFSDFSIKR